MRTSATAFAPATVGNVGIGFDILGHTVEAIGDRVRVERSSKKGVRILGITGLDANGRASVGLVKLGERHAFANIALTDNVVRFETDRYCDNPLIVQGPGAGPEVTAAGVFGDLLKLCAYLGAPV